MKCLGTHDVHTIGTTDVCRFTDARRFTHPIHTTGTTDARGSGGSDELQVASSSASVPDSVLLDALDRARNEIVALVGRLAQLEVWMLWCVRLWHWWDGWHNWRCVCVVCIMHNGGMCVVCLMRIRTVAEGWGCVALLVQLVRAELHAWKAMYQLVWKSRC